MEQQQTGSVTGDPQNLPTVTGNSAPSVIDPVVEQFRANLQNFNRLLQIEPPPEGIKNTPDNQAKYLVISHVEMGLDMLFFGLWETENFKWSVIANEVVGSLDLVVVHPVTKDRLKRVGAAAVQITVDATPDDLKPHQGDTKEQAEARKRKKNEWALDPSNKKSNALDLTFPKLKAECIKNAALSLGKYFGRDLNRRQVAPAKELRPKTKGASATAATAEALKNQKITPQ